MHEETLHPWLSKLRPVKILIRLLFAQSDETFHWADMSNCTFALVTAHITKTCLYNIDPFKPHFYIVKLGFTGVYIISLISAQKHRL